MQIPFVRVLRFQGMERGFAVDRAGKYWRGFSAVHDENYVMHTAQLGTIGICRCCGDRVYHGWECVNDKKDACDLCVFCSEDVIFEVPHVAIEVAQIIEKEFHRNANFDRSLLRRLCGQDT